MKIDKSYSKKDMIEICFTLKINIEDIQDLNKTQIQKKIIQYCKKNPKGLFLPNPYFIQTVEELKKHLETINQKKIDFNNTRDDVMRICKKITNYSRNGHLFFNYGYKTLEELTDDIDIILPYGDCPSVRKAIDLVNQDIKLKYKYEPVISQKCLQKLSIKKQLKSDKEGRLSIKRGEYQITFD